MNKNLDGVYRPLHNSKLKSIANFYVDMCIFGGLSENQLETQLYPRLRVNSYDEKVKILNPARFNKPPLRTVSKETVLYDLFLCYCLLEFVDNESAIFAHCQSCIIEHSGKNFGDIEDLKKFDNFITESFFPLYDAKIHNSMNGLTKFKTDTNSCRVMRKSENNYPLPIVSGFAPFVFETKKYNRSPRVKKT